MMPHRSDDPHAPRALMVLPWGKPPLSLNVRKHHHAHATDVKAVRGLTMLNAQQGGLHMMGWERYGRLSVRLHYLPRDKRRRDTDNLVATLKAVCDGLVDAGLAPDDTPAYMSKPEPIIHPAVKGAAPLMWLELSTVPLENYQLVGGLSSESNCA